MKNFTLIALLISSFYFSLTLNAQISTDGLLAYYPFNGNTLDSTDNTFDGIMMGGTFVEDQYGNPNAALQLNGVDEFVDLSPFAIPFRVHLNEFSIYFKIKFEKTENNQSIISLSAPGESLETNVFEIEYENDGFQIETETGSSAINHELQIDEQNSLFDDQWHEILILLDGDSITYCKDNELKYSGLYVPNESSTGALSLGCYAGTYPQSCCFFGGRIDELQFYNRLLTKNEIIVSNSNIASQESMECFPNPSNGSINVSLGKFYNRLKVELIDVTGKSFLIKEMNDLSEFELDLPLTSGVYFLQIIDQTNLKEVQTFRVVRL